MCDYSLEAFNSRAAVDGEDLVINEFPTGCKGFVADSAVGKAMSPEKKGIWASSDCAVCCKPGVEMTLYFEGIAEVFSFEGEGNRRSTYCSFEEFSGETPVVFHTLSKECSVLYRDGFTVPSGKFLSLRNLRVGTRATVTKALPKELTEAAKGETAFKEEMRVADVAPLVHARV
jgi:hypothetical protein